MRPHLYTLSDVVLVDTPSLTNVHLSAGARYFVDDGHLLLHNVLRGGREATEFWEGEGSFSVVTLRMKPCVCICISVYVQCVRKHIDSTVRHS